MFLGLTSGLSSLHGPIGDPVTPVSAIFGMLGNRDGFAIDFRAQQMRINDAATPGNAFNGHPEDKLEKFGSDGYVYTPGKGIKLDPARDFGIGLSTSVFPFNTDACTVLIKYELTNDTGEADRYLFMTDRNDNDRFVVYAPINQGMRFVSGDGANVTISASNEPTLGGQERVCVAGCDGFGHTFFDESGTQGSAATTLATSTPDFVGIGGFNNQVLRLLDGHIAEIVVITEPLPVADRLKLDLYAMPMNPPVFDKLGDRDGFAIDFRSGAMKINDKTNPSNAYVGRPEDKLKIWGADPYLTDLEKGLVLEDGRDFGVALKTDQFPFNAAACTVYAKYRVSAAESTEQRYIFMTDNSGVDRFAVYCVASPRFRFVTGDGVAANIVVSDMDSLPDVETEVLFGADLNGKTYIDAEGVQADSEHGLSSSVPTYVGIGGYPNKVLRVLDGHLAELVVITEPMPKAARITVGSLAPLYKAEGDSHTFNVSYGVAEAGFYPARVGAAFGPAMSVENFGTSGDSTVEMVNQLPDFFTSGVPDFASIYGGSNDTTTALITDEVVPTSTSFAIDNAAKYAADGWVIVNGEGVQVTDVTGNVLTVTPALAAAPAVGDGLTIDTEKNLRVWIQAVRAAGCERVLVLGAHYRNFSSGGDTPVSEQGIAAGIRAKALAAATAEGAVYVDTYAFMRDMITSGAVAEGDDLSWHVGIGNSHLNAAGEQAIADAVAAEIEAQGWFQN